MKSALLSLQGTQKLYDKTQERLTSGQKVSKPSDDPAAYYAASTLNNRADALDARLDNMDQAVEAIAAADNGISAMTSVLSSMTALVESALSSSEDDSATRAALGKKFNDLLRQLSTLANDSAYGGVNLLNGEDLTVQMGEKYNDSTFTVQGFYVAGVEQDPNTATGEVKGLVSGSIPKDWGSQGATNATQYAFALNIVENPTSIVGIQSFGAGSSLSTELVNGVKSIDAIAATAATTAAEATQNITDLQTILKSLGTYNAAAGTVTLSSENGSIFTYTLAANATTNGTLAVTDAQGNTVTTPATSLTGEDLAIYNTLNNVIGVEAGVYDQSALASGWAATSTTTLDTSAAGLKNYALDGWEVNWANSNSYTSGLSKVLNQIEQVKEVLETRSKLLSFDQSTITLRQDYTSQFINTLQEGADSLTLADLNEESANLLSLETSQSLSVQAMSLANTQMQNVLRLLQ